MSRYNFTIFRVWEIPIRINISLIFFLPILAFLIGSGEQVAAYTTVINTLTPAAIDTADLAGTNDRWLIGASAAVALFGSVTFHELGHAWAAMRYDIEVESITLWLLGGLAALSEMPREWNREFWIAIAGPMASLVLAGGCIAALAVIPESAVLVVYLVGFVAVMNIILTVFNLLPAFPMDGGRIFRALLARNRSYVSATQTAARVGTVFALIFAFVGIVVAFSPIMVLLALFIYVAATSESRSVMLGSLLEGLSVADVVGAHEPVPADATVETVFDRLLGARRTDLAVVDADRNVVGVVTASALQKVPPAEYESTTVGSIATGEFPRIDDETTAFAALDRLLQSPANVALVQREGRTVGVVSREDFSAALELRGETVAF